MTTVALSDPPPSPPPPDLGVALGLTRRPAAGAAPSLPPTGARGPAPPRTGAPAPGPVREPPPGRAGKSPNAEPGDAVSDPLIGRETWEVRAISERRSLGMWGGACGA